MFTDIELSLVTSLAPSINAIVETTCLAITLRLLKRHYDGSAHGDGNKKTARRRLSFIILAERDVINVLVQTRKAKLQMVLMPRSHWETRTV